MAATAPKEPKEPKQEAVFSVTTKRENFRRSGRAWSGTTLVKESELTDDQWSQLGDDDTFIIEQVEQGEAE